MCQQYIDLNVRWDPFGLLYFRHLAANILIVITKMLFEMLTSSLVDWSVLILPTRAPGGNRYYSCFMSFFGNLFYKRCVMCLLQQCISLPPSQSHFTDTRWINQWCISTCLHDILLSHIIMAPILKTLVCPNQDSNPDLPVTKWAPYLLIHHTKKRRKPLHWADDIRNCI